MESRGYCFSIVFLLLACCHLSGCGGGSGGGTSAVGTISPESASGTAATAPPAIDRSPTALGIDKNKNGIRDDVDALITRLATTEESSAMGRMAGALQGALIASAGDSSAIQAAFNEQQAALACLRKLQRAERLLNALLLLQLNTEVRYDSWVAYEKLVAGQTPTESVPGC